ncbi:MAG: flagellar hook-length control protein FliK [Bacillota bacterium]
MKAIESTAVSALQQVLGGVDSDGGQLPATADGKDFARVLNSLVAGEEGAGGLEAEADILAKLQSLLQIPEEELTQFLKGDGELDLFQLQELIQLKDDLDSLLAELGTGVKREEVAKDDKDPPGRAGILKLASLLAVPEKKRQEIIAELSPEEKKALDISFPDFMQGLNELNEEIETAVTSGGRDDSKAIFEMLLMISAGQAEEIPGEITDKIPGGKNLLKSYDDSFDSGAANKQMEKVITRLAQAADEISERRDILLESTGLDGSKIDVDNLTRALDSLEMSNLYLEEGLSRRQGEKTDFSLEQFLSESGFEDQAADKITVASTERGGQNQSQKFDFLDTGLPDNRGAKETMFKSLSPLKSLEAQSDNKPDIIRQITRQISRNHTSGVKKLRIQLQPESLGKVDLEMGMRDGEIQVRLLVDNSEVRNYLEQNLQGLKNSLSNQGLQVERLDIELNNNVDAGAGENNFDTGQQMQGQNGGQQGSSEDKLWYGYFEMSGEEREEVLSSYTPQELAALRLQLGNWYRGDSRYYRGTNLSAFG